MMKGLDDEKWEQLFEAVEEGEKESRRDLRDRKRKSKAQQELMEIMGETFSPHRDKKHGDSHAISQERVVAIISSFQVASISRTTGEPNFSEASRRLQTMGYKVSPHSLKFIWERIKDNPTLYGTVQASIAMEMVQHLPVVADRLISVLSKGIDVMERELDKIMTSDKRPDRDTLLSINTALMQLVDKVRDLSGLPKEATRHEVSVNHGPKAVLFKVFDARKKEETPEAKVVDVDDNG